MTIFLTENQDDKKRLDGVIFFVFQNANDGTGDDTRVRVINKTIVFMLNVTFIKIVNIELFLRKT